MHHADYRARIFETSCLAGPILGDIGGAFRDRRRKRQRASTAEDYAGERAETHERQVLVGRPSPVDTNPEDPRANETGSVRAPCAHHKTRVRLSHWHEYTSLYL